MAESELIPLDIPPGVVLDDSPNAAKGRFTSADKIHFVGKFAEKWKGWIQWIEDVLVGVGRGATTWANVVGNQNVAIGTHLKLFMILAGDTFSDITPIRDSGTLANDPFAVVNTLTTVTVTDVAHGLAENDFVHFTGATAGGGITIDGEYQVASIIDVDSYTITHSAPATSTDATTGGAVVDYEYEIAVGDQNPSIGSGYGTGTYGMGSYGVPGSGNNPIDMRHWSLQPYGNNLLASPYGGTLYDWAEGVDTRAQIIAGAPPFARAMFVTPERFPVMLGTDDGGGDVDPMRMQWPDQDDITNWVPAANNTANIRTLQNGSKLIAGIAIKDLLSGIWTDNAFYLMRYNGNPGSVYETPLEGESCGLIGPLAMVVVDGVVFWFGNQDVHMWSGAIASVPNSSDIIATVLDDMDETMRTKTLCEYDPQSDSILFRYVSNDSTDMEPDKAIEVSLETFAWSGPHSNRRTTGTTYRPGDGTRIMADPGTDGTGGILWQHGVGLDDGTDEMEASISYGKYAIAQGKENIDIMGFVPDFQRQVGDVELVIETHERPNSLTVKDTQTIVIEEGSEIEEARVCGRYFSASLRTNELGGDVRLGISQLEIQGAGRRR